MANVGDQLSIQLNGFLHNIRSERHSFRGNLRLATLARFGTANEITVRSDGAGTITLNSIGLQPFFVSIAIRNDESSLLIANIRVNVADREIRFNDNWSFNHSVLMNHRLNRSTERIPLTTSSVLHIEYDISAFNCVGENNFIIIRSCFGYNNAPLALHLTSSELLDVLWHPGQTIESMAEYHHDMYYVLYYVLKFLNHNIW